MQLTYFDKIIDGVFVGTCPTNKTDAKRLERAGFTAVLNLQSETDFARHAIDWPALKRAYSSAGITARRVPIIDFNDGDLIANLPRAARILDNLVKAGHSVYVHCTEGRQRSPSAVICYLAWHRKFKLKNAIQRVLAARHCAPPIPALETADALYGQFSS